MVRWIRQPLRDTAVRTVGRLLKTQDGKAGLAGTLSGLLDARAPLISPRETAPSAYPELGRAPDARHTPADRRPILVTARFRSGSTLLWNMFRNAGSCTAYYEPLNERRWFDPAARGRHTDRTHLHVSDYWREYNGLASLADDYQEDWIRHRLYMDERSWDPHLERYVRTLIEAAPGRPVLQFNRIDFRLAWFRHHFPDAVIVHLYRHPRDQWCSSLVNPREFPFDARMDAFAAHDHFYLLTWARDLRYYFPFIDEAT